jgi:hypothetical protein
MSNDTHPLIAGFTAGVVSTSLLLPLDVVKVSLPEKRRVNPLDRVLFELDRTTEPPLMLPIERRRADKAGRPQI